ncbi:radiation sensitive protein rad9 [Neurospora sp. IMI 360204]|nr:radiation sensitive protein rad9 [Neurospora sp. IMI 360204]
MSNNALKNNRDHYATESLDTQAVLDDYMKTYGAGQTSNIRPPSIISNPSSSSKSSSAYRPTMSKPRKQRDEDLFPPLTQSEEDRVRNSRPADDLTENKPIDMEAYRAWKARQAAERKREREEAKKPKLSWFKPSQLFSIAAQWEQEEKERQKKQKEEQEKREAEEKVRQEAQEKLEKDEQRRAEEAETAEEHKQAETQPSAQSNETTQSNGGRSYERYVASASQAKPSDTLRSSPKLGASSPSLEPASVTTTVPEPRGSRLLDTPATNKTTSRTQDGSGRVDFGSIARLRNIHSQKQQASPARQVPETPISENNPFRQGKSQLLGPSQLFGATQFSSAAKAFASPTSSRPSPSDFMHHTVSPNLAVSSPLRARGLRSSPAHNVPSSPAALPDAPPPRVTQRRLASPGPGALEDDMVIPESPQTKPPNKKRAAQRPFASYEPMDKSQERWSSSIAGSDPPGPPNDEDTETSIVRRRKAKLKKKAALEQLTEIRFPRVAKSDDVEIPSSNKNRRGKAKLATQEPEHGHEEPAIPNTVEDSQGQGAKPAAVHAVDDESTQSGPDEDLAPKPDAVFKIPRPSQRPALRPLSPVHEKPAADTSGAGADPKTSPAENLLEEESAHEPPSSSQLPALPAPSNNIPSSSPPMFERRSRKKRVSSAADQVAKIPTSSTVRTTKSRVSSSAVDAAVQTTSDLSNLSSTPVMPSSAVPARDASTSFTRPDPGSSSPTPVNNLRRDAAGRLPKHPKTSSTENMRHSARVERRLSSSADELSVSGATIPTLDHSVRMSRSSLLKPSRASSMTAPAQRGSKIFEGMAFAISFQSRRTGESADQYKARMETASNFERRIKQAGGRILDNGFDELFEPIPVQPAASTDKTHSSPPSDGTNDLLNSSGNSTGFTALIADGHSRKVKYMQALALGLPILASRWVLTCLSSNSIIDWSPYLLAAGQSAFLGDAILSRNLQPYDARTAKLVETVGRRGRWLGGSRILLVMSTGGGDKKGRKTQKEKDKEKQEEGRKMAYVFLARVLGAELRRAGSVEEAKMELERAEKEAEGGKGKPYDWVYVDGKTDGAELFTSPAAMVGESDAGNASASASASGVGAGGGRKSAKGKKRKRQSVGYVYEPTEAEKQPPLKKIRTLSDELVIQSLILGRMIDEEEFGSI